MSMDEVVEGLGRRLAARTTRRTMLGRFAKVGVLVAGGPALATLLAERAEARVCGQSGVSPRCPTFDCTYPDSVWGWCWYASGSACCAGGGLKKICDCCTTSWPNVHGYCPSGTNVRCIVESCHADPRVMYVPIQRADGNTGMAVAAARARLEPPGRGGTLVVGDAEDPKIGAVAAAIAAGIGAGFVLTPRDRLAAAVLAEVQRRNATEVVVVGATLPASFDDELAAYGPRVERTGGGVDLASMSVTAARWLVGRTGAAEAVCIETTGASGSAASAAAAFAGAGKLPLLLGVQAAKDLAAPEGTWFVGNEAADLAAASGVPTPRPLHGGTKEAIALTLATQTVQHYKRRELTVHLAPQGAPDVSAGLAGAGGVLLYHPGAALGTPIYGFVNNHRAAFNRAVLGGSFGTLGNQGIYDLQSALHHFDTHRLQGRSGQGLPVVSQPRAEREIGRARLAGATPEQEPAYWSSRAKVVRKG